ncbi:sulfotransferase family protein [Planktothrix paucivesiculata]|uniref:Sulfotransferase n=1 Tax=Planktothrix paucivesiculata PCC 9631 TaxID=671071 RepID=A0A7Z9BY18_9CYAN|nr:sulfotransferase [Planktothrix paucivesiculata]VXD23287.1 conserved hypothetical protein [Planktothrix paucivesiculata PCC 9631]
MKPLVFLIGCSRSGTTLLQSLLAIHPDIASFPETHIFQYLFANSYEPRRHALGLSSRHLKPKMEKFIKEELGRPELLKYLPHPLFKKLYAEKFIKILEILADEEGKKIVLEKTPDHIYCLEKIEKYFPQAKFIHLLRNGADVVASLYEVTHEYPQSWGGARNIDQCLTNWINAVQISQKYVSKPNHHLVRYENLIQAPKETLQEICTAIKINFDQNMIDNYGISAKILSSDSVGRSVNCQGIIGNSSNKFTRIFNLEQQEYILNRLSIIDLDNLANKKS